MREKELRLALVCYGGISLAVYMHGITKEIWHLARASRAHADGAEPTGGTARIFRDLLAEVEDETGTRLRVLADIIAGASAGGINGIFLGQAIATGQSLEPLTDLWLNSADVEALIDPEAAPSSRFSKAWALPLAWMAAGRSAESVEQLDDPATREEVRRKLSHFVRSRWFEPPFGGTVFTGMLLNAFDAMAASERGPRLLPDDQPLDLFVTVTDFTGHPERLRLHSPAEVVETEHRLVIGFGDRGAAVDTLAHPAELAFAARATSSFPGAFPPFTVAEMDRVLATRGVGWPHRRDFLRRTLPRQFAAGQAEKAVLIDGSVLANAPFRPAIDALKERPARRQIDRRFVYIDPSPGTKIRVTRGAEPGFFQTILGALSDLPRQQPIRDNLEAIAARSERIDRLQGIVAAIRPQVEGEVQGLFGRTLFINRPTPARLANWRRRAQVAAAARAGYGYAAYAHLKVAGVIDTVARHLYRAGGQHGATRFAAIRRSIEKAARARGVDPLDPAAGVGAANNDTVDFLRRFDLDFRIRRLRLLARRLLDLEHDLPHADLTPLRDALYASLADYLDRQRTDSLGELRRPVRTLLRRSDAEPLLLRLDALLDLARIDADTDVRLSEGLAALDREPRRVLLLTYLGFPYFDVATLPLLQGEGFDEFDPIKVDRIAPDDATAIRAGGAEATLKGIQFNSFGAFFSRGYRENDYLWGRLHGAERMIDIVVSTLPSSARMKPGRVAAIKRAAFRAILDEEEPRLRAIGRVIDTIRAEVG